MKRVVIVELDYKGFYSRFALTQEEFRKEYGPESETGIPDATQEAASWTLRPLVHIWYQIIELGSALFNEFFKDMSWGLPESDIESNNLAYIDEDKIKDPDIRAEIQKMGVLFNG